MIKVKNVGLAINYQGIIAVVIALLIAAVFSETALTYINTWLKFDESMGHALIIVTIVIFYLLKPNKTQCNNVQKRTHWLLIIPICLLIMFHQVSAFWGILVFQQFSLYFLWLLGIYFILGNAYFKQNLFPLLFFLFAVPFWEFLNPIFLYLTTVAVTYLLDFTPVIAYMDGNLIELPFGMLEIAGGCSGLRYFEIAFALAVFAVHQENISKRLKLLVIILAIILGIATNWIRVLSLIYVGYESQMTSELMNDHETHGLVLFMLVITPLIFFINWLSAKYSLKKAENSSKMQTTTNSKFTPQKYWCFAVFLLCTISISSILNIEDIKTNTTSSEAPIKSTMTHPALSDYGKYNQEVTQYQKDCQLIVRHYQFTAAGTNALPFNNIYNSKNYSQISSNIAQVPNWPINIDSNYLNLKNKHTEQIEQLYYWYKYKDISITNKYVAKLFEIVFLFDERAKMTVNIIICS
jgi:exosortase